MKYDTSIPDLITFQGNNTNPICINNQNNMSQPIQMNKSRHATISQRYFATHPLLPCFSQSYTLMKELGSGGFGFVCSAYSKLDSSNVAVKFIFKHKVPASSWIWDDLYGQVPAEVFYLRQINHPNVVSFRDYFEDANLCYLVTELHGSEWAEPTSPKLASLESYTMVGGLPSPTSSSPPPNLPHPSESNSSYLSSSPPMDLFECIEQHDCLSESDARYIFRQIMEAVAYLHSRGLVHRDIKDENILIDASFQVKLIDFGSCASFDDQTRFDRFLGTIQYASPEILAARPFHGPSAEVWALGCCLYIMLNGQVPFSNARQALSLPMNRPKVALSSPCIDLLLTMLQKDPLRRPSVSELLRHPWFSLE